MSKHLRYITLFFFCLSVPFAAQASSAGWAAGDQVQARLHAGDQEGQAALEVRLSKGWHTYWRAPGDAGLPPRFDWSGSSNVERVEVLWPFPQRYDENGLTVFGYKDEVFFPLKVHKTDPAQPASLDLKLDIMACYDICIPEQLKLQADLEKQSGEARKLIDYKTRLVPADTDTPALKIETIVVGPDAIVVNAFSKDGFTEADIFATAGGYAFTPHPEITVGEDKRNALLRIPRPADIEKLADFLQGQELNITLVNGRHAVEKTVSF